MLRLRLRLGAATWSKRWCQAGGRVQLVAAAWIHAACCVAVFHAGMFALGSFRGGQPQVVVDGAVFRFRSQGSLAGIRGMPSPQGSCPLGEPPVGGRSPEQVRADHGQSYFGQA